MTRALAQQDFEASFAQTDADLRAAQRLRYEVFVKELGAAGQGVDHDARLETDHFDAFADHLLLRNNRDGEVVGVYRLLNSEQARKAGGFYCESEFDLTRLKASGKSLLELGRSCLRADVRGSGAMFVLWNALSEFVERTSAEVIFGVASISGTNIDTLKPALSVLHAHHLASEDIRPVSRAYQDMNLVPKDQLDRKAAVLSLPALLKGYLRLGGLVGDGAFVDHAFKCTDVCMMLDTKTLNARHARLYTGA